MLIPQGCLILPSVIDNETQEEASVHVHGRLAINAYFTFLNEPPISSRYISFPLHLSNNIFISQTFKKARNGGGRRFDNVYNMMGCSCL